MDPRRLVRFHWRVVDESRRPSFAIWSRRFCSPAWGCWKRPTFRWARARISPYQVLGAPWIHATDFAAYLNARKIEGVRFTPVQFTPGSGTYARQQCSGVQMMVVDRETIDTAELAIELAAALHKLYPQQFEMAHFADLLGNQAAFQALQSGEDPRRIADDWRDGTDQFMQVRAKYLLY